jgi:hypothetical protein
MKAIDPSHSHRHHDDRRRRGSRFTTPWMEMADRRCHRGREQRQAWEVMGIEEVGLKEQEGTLWMMTLMT